MEEAAHYAAAVMENTAYVCTWLVGFRSKEEQYKEHKRSSQEHKVPSYIPIMESLRTIQGHRKRMPGL
jgi:hypothetical protein